MKGHLKSRMMQFVCVFESVCVYVCIGVCVFINQGRLLQPQHHPPSPPPPPPPPHSEPQDVNGPPSTDVGVGVVWVEPVLQGLAEYVLWGCLANGGR